MDWYKIISGGGYNIIMCIINAEDELIALNSLSFANKEAVCLTHYTNISSFFKIIRTKQLKFNRIDNLNDLTEKQLLQDKENYKRVFVSCFSRSCKELIPMWKMYTDKQTGIRLRFYPKKDTKFRDLFELDYVYTGNKMIALDGCNITNATEKSIVARFDGFDVEYGNKKDLTHLYIKSEDKDYNVPYYFSSRKSKAWQYEKEFRYRILLKAYGRKIVELKDYFSLFLNIKFDAFEKIEIIFSPEINKLDWEDIIEDFKTKQSLKTKFVYHNSVLYEKIRL